ncbi:MAG: hypothetical protein ABL901_09125 [Hyphomicrobiaceae bacterium]
MAKAAPTAHDKITSAIARAQAGNGRSLAALIGDVSPGDLADSLAQTAQLMADVEWNALKHVLAIAAQKQAERDRARAEKLAAQRAARAKLKAVLDAEYLGGVHAG